MVKKLIKKDQINDQVVEKTLPELDLCGEAGVDQVLFAGKTGCGSCG